MNHIVIINGKPRTGKDSVISFAESLSKEFDYLTTSLSAVDPVREIMRIWGFNPQDKTEVIRDAMSKTKDFLSQYNLPLTYLLKQIHSLPEYMNNLVFICMREPKDIDELKKIVYHQNLLNRRRHTKVTTVVVRRDTAGVPDTQATNHADLHTDLYDYDYEINNDSDLAALNCKVQDLLKDIL